MATSEKQTLRSETNFKHCVFRFVVGLKSIFSNHERAGILFFVCLILLTIWSRRDGIVTYAYPDLQAMGTSLFLLLFLIFTPLILFLLIYYWGYTPGAWTIERSFRRVGFLNSAGEAPFLMTKRLDVQNPRVCIFDFEMCGLPRVDWEDKKDVLEAALNMHIVKISDGVNRRRILLYAVQSENAGQKITYWKPEYLSNNSFELVLGESPVGSETVNLNITPHILIGGSTGSGKSILLKCVLMQCIQKGADVYIADFKGGVDYLPIWHQRCNIVTDEISLLNRLGNIVFELERRKELFLSSESRNIDEHNCVTSEKLSRIIFACDEVAELLDKSGLSKDAKDILLQIEARIATIARQGRAFGIHLILSTQRPDANILAGQIKTNLDIRICGRANNILSQIILDHGDASKLIPPDAQGRFLTNTGTIIQGYLFDENLTI